MLAASALLLLAVGVITGSLGEGTTQLSLTVPMDRAGPMVVILAQAATFSCMYLLYFVLQKYGGPVYFSLLGSVAAVVGVPIAVFVLGEAPPQGLAIGGVLIAIGVGLLTFGHAEETETPQPSPDVE